MCSLFTERHRGRNATFFRPSDGRKAVFQRRAVCKKTPGRPHSRPEVFPGENRGGNAERTKPKAPLFSGEGLGNDVAGTLRAAAAHAALCAWARPQAGRSPSPQRGRNQKNGRRLRSKKMKQDARLSNKKAARPHEDSARTSRLTGKAFSDRSCRSEKAGKTSAFLRPAPSRFRESNAGEGTPSLIKDKGTPGGSVRPERPLRQNAACERAACRISRCS